nr:hypothetical protein [Alteripontixanthobacter maritimus]
MRQFAHADRDWFFDQPLRALQGWLTDWLDSGLFARIMAKPE